MKVLITFSNDQKPVNMLSVEEVDVDIEKKVCTVTMLSPDADGSQSIYHFYHIQSVNVLEGDQ